MQDKRRAIIEKLDRDAKKLMEQQEQEKAAEIEDEELKV